MNTLETIVIILFAVVWFVELLRLTGKPTFDLLPRPTLRDQVRLWKSHRQARRQHDLLLRACVLTPEREDIQLALAHAQVLLVSAGALRKRDAKLAVTATEAMAQTRTMMVQAREARAYATVYRERQEAVN